MWVLACANSIIKCMLTLHFCFVLTCRYPARSAATHLRWQAARRWPHVERLQHPERIDPALGSASPRWYADLCEDSDWQDYYTGGRTERHYRECQGQDPGQRRYAVDRLKNLLNKGSPGKSLLNNWTIFDAQSGITHSIILCLLSRLAFKTISITLLLIQLHFFRKNVFNVSSGFIY